MRLTTLLVTCAGLANAASYTITAGQGQQTFNIPEAVPTGGPKVNNKNEIALSDIPSSRSQSVPPTASSTCISYTPTPQNPKLRCDFRGKLTDPVKPYKKTTVASFNACKDLCLQDTTTPCDSFGYDAPAGRICSLYDTRIDPQGPMRGPGPVYSNRRCYVDHCGASLLRSGSCEPDGEPAECFWGIEAHIGISKKENKQRTASGASSVTNCQQVGNSSNYQNAADFELFNSTGNTGVAWLQRVPLTRGRIYDFAWTFTLDKTQGPSPDLNVSIGRSFHEPWTGALFIPGERLPSDNATTIYGHLTPPITDSYLVSFGLQHGNKDQFYPRRVNLTFSVTANDFWLVERPRYPGS